IALVTDYDCWHPDHDAVTVEMIIEYLNKNSANAQMIIRDAARRLATTPRDCKCGGALRHAILTQPAAIPVETKKKLAAILGKYVGE
ncbi:MAG TPA: S-methyl-5'-thioadenosine phosphorylase, partial [Blastocatellia bacterium]|nr:S-methyl-5'-thioadenosine phosphorylase [Blastocatellia bacterium]